MDTRFFVLDLPDGKKLYYDPFRLWRILYQNPKFRLDDYMDAVSEGREPETTEFVRHLAEVFGVKRWEPGMTPEEGLTDIEIIGLLSRFGAWLQEVAGFFGFTQISPQPTEPKQPDSSPQASSPQESSVTIELPTVMVGSSLPLGSGSTDSAPVIDTP